MANPRTVRVRQNPGRGTQASQASRGGGSVANTATSARSNPGRGTQASQAARATGSRTVSATTRSGGGSGD